MGVRTVLCSALFVVLHWHAMSADNGSLRLLVHTAESFGETYTRPPTAPGATYVYFIGERVRLRCVIQNVSDSDDTFVAGALDPQHALTVDARRESMPIDVTAVVGTQLTKRNGRFEEPVTWAPRITLKPHELLEWDLEIGSIAAPGAYVLHFSVSGSDEQGRQILPQGSKFGFELRTATAADQPEILRRQALRAFVHARYEEAARFTNELLQIHSSSFEAHVIRGDIAKQERRTAEADREFRQAISLLDSRADQLFFEIATPQQVQQTIDGIKARMSQPR